MRTYSLFAVFFFLTIGYSFGQTQQAPKVVWEKNTLGFYSLKFFPTSNGFYYSDINARENYFRVLNLGYFDTKTDKRWNTSYESTYPTYTILGKYCGTAVSNGITLIPNDKVYISGNPTRIIDIQGNETTFSYCSNNQLVLKNNNMAVLRDSSFVQIDTLTGKAVAITNYGKPYFSKCPQIMAELTNGNLLVSDNYAMTVIKPNGTIVGKLEIPQDWLNKNIPQTKIPCNIFSNLNWIQEFQNGNILVSFAWFNN